MSIAIPRFLEVLLNETGCRGRSFCFIRDETRSIRIHPEAPGLREKFSQTVTCVTVEMGISGSAFYSNDLKQGASRFT